MDTIAAPAVLANGRSSEQIADALHISVKTVDHYRATLMTKLGIPDIAGLTRYAVNAGMVGAEALSRVFMKKNRRCGRFHLFRCGRGRGWTDRDWKDGHG